MARNEKFNLDLNNDENFQLGVDQEEEDFVVDFGEVINTGGGTNYNELSNKPKINGITLQGNKNGADYNLADIYSVVFTAGEQGAIYASQEDLDYIYANVPTYMKVSGNVSGTEISQIYVLLGENNITGSYSGELIYFTYQDWSNNYNMVRIPKNASSPLNFYEYDFYTKSESDTKFQAKLVSGTNIKTINNSSILGSGNINIESGYPEVPAKLYEYTNLLDLLDEPMYVPDGIYTVSQEWYCDIPKENDEWVNDNINPNSILYIYRPYGFISWTGPTSSIYWSNGDETFTGGIITTVDDVKSAIDEKIGDNYVTIGTDQTINSNKTIGKGKKLTFSGTSPNTSDASIENNYGFIRFAHGSNEIMFIGSSGVYINGAMSPNITNSFNLGNNSNKWNTLYVNKLNDGTNEKNISNLLTNDGNIIPSDNRLYTLGDIARQWSILYLSNSLRFDPQQNTKIENLKTLSVNTIKLGQQQGSTTTWMDSNFLQVDTTDVKCVGKLLGGLNVNNMAVHNIPDTPDDGTSPINKNYADNNLQGKLTAGTGIAISNNVISSTLEGIDYEVDQELPATGEKGIIYLIPNGSSETENIYDEYIWIPPLQEGESGRFEFIGTTQTDLTNYVDLTSAQTITGAKTFSSTILPSTNNNIDLGDSSKKWKDLYLAGNLSDGTNSVAVNKIANKDNFITLSQADYDALATKDPDTYYFIEEE